MDRIRAISMEIMGKYRSDFGVDFIENKKELDNISIIRSKSLKNKIAGFITRFIKHELREREEKERREKEFDRKTIEDAKAADAAAEADETGQDEAAPKVDDAVESEAAAEDGTEKPAGP